MNKRWNLIYIININSHGESKKSILEVMREYYDDMMSDTKRKIGKFTGFLDDDEGFERSYFEINSNTYLLNAHESTSPGDLSGFIKSRMDDKTQVFTPLVWTSTMTDFAYFPDQGLDNLKSKLLHEWFSSITNK